MRRTCSSIGPSSLEMTASPPSVLSSSIASRRRTTLSVLKPSWRPRLIIIRPSVEPAADWSSHSPRRTFSTCRAMASTVAGLMKATAACSSGISSGSGRACRAGDHRVLGPVAARAVDRDDPLPLDKAAEQPGPNLIDDADTLETRRRGQLGQHAVPAAHDQDVGRIDRAQDHPDPDLARPRMRLRYVPDLEHLFRIPKPLEDGGFHLLSVVRCP